MQISVIAAMGQNHVIGDDRGLPWRLPRDLKRFKDLTWGKPVIMGRKTFDLIGKPLASRLNIVLTRSEEHAADVYGRGGLPARTPQEALTAARQFLDRYSGVAGFEAEAMIIGGGEVYRLFLDLAERVYLTVVEGEFKGTATFPFPDLARQRWRVSRSESAPADATNPHADQFFILDKLAATDTSSLAEPFRLLAG